MIAQATTLKARPRVIVDGSDYNFVVVGAGGTGSYLIRDLARLISVNNKQFKTNHTLTIVDKDIVEEKNLTRQNFIAPDVGKNKAEVLAKRYSKGYGITIDYVPDYITNNNRYDIARKDNEDNNNTRHILHNAHRYQNHRPSVYIDSGNEEFGGQVVFSSSGIVDVENSGYATSRTKGPHINDIVEEFNIDNNDKHPDEQSCAEHAVSAPQNIATNIMAGNIIFGYANLMMVSHRMWRDYALRNQLPTLPEYSGKRERDTMQTFVNSMPCVTAHVTYFNSQTGQISTKPFEI
jgi:molybdopterin/thiamine biosynthesis adenylyltransferase